MENLFLETERLYLRRMTNDDFDEVKEMLFNPKVMSAWEYTFTEQDVKEWIKKNLDKYQKYSLGYFLVLDKISTKVLGQAALMPDEIDGKNYYEIGYIFKPENWHKGYATECALALADYAFKTLCCQEVIFEIKTFAYSRAQAQNIVENWKKNATNLYPQLIGLLTKK